MCHLTQKYNVPGPRYTSYPTVPHWDLNNFSGKHWKESVVQGHITSKEEGISLYVHLPFCESMCTFCGCHKRITKRHEVELPYIRAVLKEWKLYRELLGTRPLIREIHLGGGTPTFFSPEHLQQLVEGILRFATVSENANFSFEGHPNNTTKAHLQTLYQLGFRKVCYGVQDYNQKVQKAIHRVQAFENVQKVTQWARDIGYTSVGHDIIYGLPFQTLEDIRNTISATNQLTPDRIAFYSYAHVPWRKGNGQRGFAKENLPTAHEKSMQSQLGNQLLSEVGYKSIGLDHYALPTDALYKAAKNKSLHRNFMGYTDQKTNLLIGLGASSISDSGSCFAQNVKGIEEYQHLLESNVLPVYRGHLLNKEDQMIQRHILNLMCNFETYLDEEQFGQSNFQQLIKNLKELIADDLVIFDSQTLKVTKKGKPFVRNVCMAFDMKLHQRKSDEPLFSMTV